MQLKNSHLVYFILPWLIYDMIWVVQYIVPLAAELRCKGTLDVLFLLCHCFPAMEVQPAYQLLCFSLDWNVSTSCGWIIAKAGKHIYGLSVVLWFRMKYCISPAFWCIHIKNSMQIFMCSKESFCFWLSPDFSSMCTMGTCLFLLKTLQRSIIFRSINNRSFIQFLFWGSNI